MGRSSCSILGATLQLLLRVSTLDAKKTCQVDLLNGLKSRPSARCKGEECLQWS
jgi:hypothetical protein